MAVSPSHSPTRDLRRDQAAVVSSGADGWVSAVLPAVEASSSIAIVSNLVDIGISFCISVTNGRARNRQSVTKYFDGVEQRGSSAPPWRHGRGRRGSARGGP